MDEKIIIEEADWYKEVNSSKCCGADIYGLEKTNTFICSKCKLHVTDWVTYKDREDIIKHIVRNKLYRIDEDKRKRAENKSRTILSYTIEELCNENKKIIIRTQDGIELGIEPTDRGTELYLYFGGTITKEYGQWIIKKEK